LSTLPPLVLSQASLPLSLCCFRSTGHHRDLHSFPTRRSSDLIHRGPVPPRSATAAGRPAGSCLRRRGPVGRRGPADASGRTASLDRKSTRLNSSHVKISYAVFCLKKKKKKHR